MNLRSAEQLALVIAPRQAVALASRLERRRDDLSTHIDLASVEQGPKAVRIARKISSVFLIEAGAKQIHSELKFTNEFPLRGMAGLAKDDAECFQIFLFEPIQPAIRMSIGCGKMKVQLRIFTDVVRVPQSGLVRKLRPLQTWM